MAVVIGEYQEHFSQITAEIVSETNKLTQLYENDSNQVSNKIQQLIRDAHDLLEQIDLEIRMMTHKEKEKYQMCLKSYNVELNKLEKDYKKALQSMPHEAMMRNELFGSDDTLVTEDMKAKLLDNTEIMEHSLHRLGDGFRICIETEQIGAQVLEDLSHQRSTLQRSRSRLQKTNEELGKSSRILTSMIRRTIQNRFLMVLIGIFMIIIISTTLYFIFRPH